MCEGSSSSDSEPSQEEDQWKNHQPSHGSAPSTSLRVRELRNRFVCSVGLSAYSTRRRTQEVAVRACRRIEKRTYPPSPPSRQIMPEDSDSQFMIDRDRDSDEIFSPRRESSFRKRHLRRVSSKSMNSSRPGRMDRLLRPLKSQCYADPHSSMHSDSDNENRRQENDCKYFCTVFFTISM